jgi:hypothetical protein
MVLEETRKEQQTYKEQYEIMKSKCKNEGESVRMKERM